MSNRRLFVIALLAVSPALAQAQFTTFIPPKNKVEDSVKAVVVAEQKAQADTAAAVRLTNMKTWVDSAAGVLPVSKTLADSLATGRPTAGRTAPERPVADAPVMRNGSRAPATASALPMIAFAGAAGLSLGVLLLRRKRPAPARARVRTRA